MILDPDVANENTHYPTMRNAPGVPGSWSFRPCIEVLDFWTFVLGLQVLVFGTVEPRPTDLFGLGFWSFVSGVRLVFCKWGLELVGIQEFKVLGRLRC